MNSVAAPVGDVPQLRDAHSLRVAHFTMGRCNPESANGIDRMVYHLSRTQAALGHEVAVFSLTDKPPIEIPGVRVSVYPNRFAVPSWLGARAQDLIRGRSPINVPRRLMADLTAWKPDVLHLHFVHVPQNIVLARRLGQQGTPYCVTIHGGLAPSALRRRRWRKMLFAALIERRYLNQAAFLHALGQEDREGLRAYGVDNRITEAPNGIDLDLLPQVSDRSALHELPPALDGKHVFLFVGRLDPEQKGLDLLFRAFASLARPDAGLLLVGPDWRGSLARLTALARELGIERNVVFAGAAFGQRKADLLGVADVFVHPSRWEGFPVSVLEAAASGKPCLLTRASDPGGVLAESGAALLADATVESIANGLRRFLEMDEDSLAEMGRRGREVVTSRFSWRPIAETLLDAYQRYALGHA